MTRMGSAFLDADLLSYLGISWATTNVTLNTYNSVYPGLVGIAQTAGQTLNDVFSTTLGPNSTLLFSGTGGFTGTRGLGVHAQPPGGGDFRADGGRFVFMSGRPYRMNATSLSTNVEWIVENLFGEPYTPPVAVESPAGPVALQLSRPRPHPFRSTVALTVELPVASEVGIGVFDTGGRRVRSLLSARLQAGAHDVTWDGRNGQGTVLAPGIYFVTLRSANEVVSRRVIRMP
jgi:hypothetical protein